MSARCDVHHIGINFSRNGDESAGLIVTGRRWDGGVQRSGVWRGGAQRCGASVLGLIDVAQIQLSLDFVPQIIREIRQLQAFALHPQRLSSSALMGSEDEGVFPLIRL